jgi:two-component system CheB/CheR fusion protein
MIVFTDVAAPAEPRRPGRSRAPSSRSAQVTELESDLRHARTELSSTREVMQRSQEDLKSANEEMQSTNEELQSTNEELTTAKEEMQSMNEELQTVNHELQGRVDELSRANNDMKNLLNSTDIATLFLDDEMRVRRFTTQAAKIIKLIPGDVGRPITDLASDLLYPDLVPDVRAVLRTLGSAEKPVAVRDGAWFTVRIMPYRTLDDRIDGAVITFTDITVAKTLEAKLRVKQAVLERHVARQSGQMERVRARAAAVRRGAGPEPGAP